MPTTPPPAPPPKQGSPSIWRLLLARFCLRIAGFELRRGRYGRIARFGTSAAVNLGRAASRPRAGQNQLADGHRCQEIQRLDRDRLVVSWRSGAAHAAKGLNASFASKADQRLKLKGKAPSPCFRGGEA